MPASTDEYSTFYHYSDKLNVDGSDPEQTWRAITNAYTLLEEWFDDRRLYHLVGFLIWEDTDLNELLAPCSENHEKGLQTSTSPEIYRLTVGDEDLTALHPRGGRRAYRRPSGPACSIGATPRRSAPSSCCSTLRHCFRAANPTCGSSSELKTFQWDIEHIRSVASDQPGSRTGRIEWLEHCAGYSTPTGEHPRMRTEIQQFHQASSRTGDRRRL